MGFGFGGRSEAGKLGVKDVVGMEVELGVGRTCRVGAEGKGGRGGGRISEVRVGKGTG